MTNPLRYVVSTPTRLAVTAVLAAGALIAQSLWFDWLVDTQTQAMGVNSLLIVLWLLSILGVSYLEGLFIGDLAFPRGWRDHLMLSRGQRLRSGPGGPGAPPAEDDADDDGRDELFPGRRFRSYTIHFSFLVGLLLLGNTVLVGQLGSGALWRVSEVQLATALRSGEAKAQLRGIERVTRLGEEHMLHRFADRLVELTEDPKPDVASAALYGLARLGMRMRISMEELRRSHEAQRWEKGLFERLRESHGAHLLKRFRDEPALRIPLAAALGALQVPDAVRQLKPFVLWQTDPEPEVVEAIVVALGDVGDLHGLAVPVEVIGRDDGQLHPAASWAAGELLALYEPDLYTREPRSVPQAVAILSGRLGQLSLPGKCALVEAFARVRDARAGAALFALFDATADDVRCVRAERKRPYGPPLVMNTDGPLRMKTLQAIAHIAGGNPEVIEWIEQRLADGALSETPPETLSETYRRSMEKVLEAARKAGE